VSFTQQQINAGHVMYEYSAITGDGSSWLSWNGSQHQWPSQQDSFQLTVTAAGADPVLHKSVTHDSNAGSFSKNCAYGSTRVYLPQ